MNIKNPHQEAYDALEKHDPPKWLPHSRGNRCSLNWEISVVLSSNLHGRISYGWIGPEKILVHDHTGECNCPKDFCLFDEQLALAEDMARRLNQ